MLYYSEPKSKAVTSAVDAVRKIFLDVALVVHHPYPWAGAVLYPTELGP